MKVAIIHDWLVTQGGAEKVLGELLGLYPNADLYSLVDFVPQPQRSFLRRRPVCTSFIQNLPLARTHYRHYLPLMPLAIEQFDLSPYDLIISSSYSVAKGVITGPDQLHVGYVHSPMRYAWDLQHQYLRDSRLQRGPMSIATRVLLHYLRIWDTRTAPGIDFFVANSRFIARRIRKVYRREARVIYPPVDVDQFEIGESRKEDFYLTASRLVPYKRIDLIVLAFTKMPDRRLVVIGDGPERARIERLASSNVDILGYQTSDVLLEYMQKARAFVHAAEEDFGIVPLEAQACGTPVIAYGKGGNLETVRGVGSNGPPTGIFFPAQSVDDLRNAINRFEEVAEEFNSVAVRAHALGFGADRFRREFDELITEQWTRFQANEQSAES